MGSLILHTFLFIFSIGVGYLFVKELLLIPYAIPAGFALGIGIAIGVILVEKNITRVSLKTIIGGLTGLIIGLLLVRFTSWSIDSLISQYPDLILPVNLFLNGLFAYLGLSIGIRKGREFDLSQFKTRAQRKEPAEDYKILDTSVIIDGRIADICETGFIQGTLVIPQFILLELQRIADSPDSIKRARGRRGLDILNRIQKQVDVNVKIVDQDFPKFKDVDSKIIALAKAMKAKIITNDFNLNKVAELQGISVMNINQLANALKPVVLPGEVMKVRIIREGKEEGQGVAYLDDGTMIVIDNAKKYVGKVVEVAVTSVLQTTAGRMIFTVLKEEAQDEYYQQAN
jgi:uncharacterized protein YacL